MVFRSSLLITPEPEVSIISKASFISFMSASFMSRSSIRDRLSGVLPLEFPLALPLNWDWDRYRGFLDIYGFFKLLRGYFDVISISIKYSI